MEKFNERLRNRLARKSLLLESGIPFKFVRSFFAAPLLLSEVRSLRLLRISIAKLLLLMLILLPADYGKHELTLGGSEKQQIQSTDERSPSTSR